MKIREIETVKQTKELGKLEKTDASGEDGIDQSRRMVTHKYSTCQDKSGGDFEVIEGAGVRKGIEK
jgi:hypothetical protein